MASEPQSPIDFLDELQWRGLIHQCTDLDGLRRHLASPGTEPRSAYVGYDPTAPSLTIGNLVTIMMLVHFWRAGHQPVVVMGGGTGMIGDPSGKSAERQLNTIETVRANVEAQRPIFERIFANAAAMEGRPAYTPPLVNNADWLLKLGFIEVLRDVGKHFSVNEMIKRDSVRDRLERRDQGISYTEFSYILLQSYDFLVLFRDFKAYGLDLPVTLQMGGSDQWGNIVGGIDLIGKAASGSKSLGLTCPLVTKADGGKFGKTESGAIWLTPDRTSPYAYYQFWLNAADADVERFLKVFTLLSKARIDQILAEHAADPGRRIAQRELARAATALLHGPHAVEQAEHAAAALFSGDVASVPRDVLLEALGGVPSTEHDVVALDGPGGVMLIDLLAVTSLARSKTEARQLLAEGSISVNGKRHDGKSPLTRADLLHGSLIALRKGKKHWHLTRWT